MLIRERRAPFSMTHHSPQYAWPDMPLSQTRNNLSVRCFVREQKLFTVTDCRVQMAVTVRVLNLDTVWKLQQMMGEIWLGEWGMWLMVVQVSFLKCDMLSQFRDRYSKVLLSQLMTSSFQGNKLYSLPFRSTEQKARLRGKLSVFFFYNKPTGNHRPLTDASQVVLSGKSKFTTQLYNLFLFSLPHLDLWTRKDVSSSEIEWNGHFREKSL